MLGGLAGVLFGVLYCDPVRRDSPIRDTTNNYGMLLVYLGLFLPVLIFDEAVILDCEDNKTTAFIYKWGRGADGLPVVSIATNDFNVPHINSNFGGMWYHRF
jgi:hypothetical protein